ncbi:MAG: YwaF family protein [Clostridia bacterium]|nr:YwaF family protein [Clostridia bacterium]
MNPVLFGKEHIIYIVISIIVATVVCICAKKFAKTEKSQKILMRCLGGVLLAIIFFNRVALVFEGQNPNWLKLLTDSFCSTSSYVLSLSLIFGKKDNNVLHFVWLISLAGGVITTFAPDFIGQNPSFLYPPTILGLMHHTWSAILVILMFIFKYINITYKKWYCTLIGFLSYFTYGAFLMCVLNFGNPFYMVRPALSGTPLTAWVIAPIYIVVYAIVLLVVELVRKRRKNNKQKIEEI